MAGSVTRGAQTLPVTSASQAVGVPSASGTSIDGDIVPYTFSADENVPSRKVSPDGIAQTFSTGQAAITTTAGSPTIAANPARLILVVRNIGAVDCYLGGSGMSSSTGYLLRANESFDVRHVAALYAVTASGTTTLAYWEEVG